MSIKCLKKMNFIKMSLRSYFHLLFAQNDSNIDYDCRTFLHFHLKTMTNVFTVIGHSRDFRLSHSSLQSICL